MIPGTTRILSLDNFRSRERDSISRFWSLLSETTQIVGHRAEACVAALGICMTDFSILEMLLHHGPQPVNVLGHGVFRTSGSISTAVARLERRGFVVKKLDPDDGRGKLVDLTAAGRRAFLPVVETLEASMEDAVSTLQRPERVELMRLLDKISRTPGNRTTGKGARPVPAAPQSDPAAG